MQAHVLRSPTRERGCWAPRERHCMWPQPSEVQQLLVQAREGDAAAEERLLELVREPLRRLIAQRLNRQVTRREDASDVVQLVLMEVHQRLREYVQNPTMSFQLWVQ